MKKTLTTLLILFGICSASFAQRRDAVEFGANIGYNAASVSYSGSGYSSDYTSGLNLGFSAEYYFSNRWSIKGKLIYDQKGWGNGYLILPDNSEIDGVDIHLNYLTIPVMANWHFGRTRNWYLHFGPYVGFLLDANESSNSGLDIKPAFNSTEIGFDAGVGVKFPVSNHVKLFIELDGQGGFNNVIKYSDGTVQTERSSINFGVLFPLR
ncbi:MAG TPA: porin family protein [Mucilaginibacter sp.]|jgi:opacity protein-like surface antigen|nr:porin family protein [Mucilaginibacter sp.]